MNSKKGFAGVATIVIIAILALGGGYYFIKKSGNGNAVPSGNTASDSPISDNQSITVLSPNGGEIYSVGSEIEVRWNINLKEKGGLILHIVDSQGMVVDDKSISLGLAGPDLNSYPGVFSMIVPSVFPGKYKILIDTYGNSSPVSDMSDGFFTINNPNSVGLGTYRNEKYGFTINFPKHWNKVKFEEGSDYVDFSLPTDGIRRTGEYDPISGYTFARVFVISIVDKNEWVRHIREDTLVQETEIAENDGKVFVYSKGQDDVGFKTLPDNGVSKGPYYDVDKMIIPTFKFTN